jgi:hypothetical protein
MVCPSLLLSLSLLSRARCVAVTPYAHACAVVSGLESIITPNSIFPHHIVRHPPFGEWRLCAIAFAGSLTTARVVISELSLLSPLSNSRSFMRLYPFINPFFGLTGYLVEAFQQYLNFVMNYGGTPHKLDGVCFISSYVPRLSLSLPLSLSLRSLCDSLTVVCCVAS